ncbi:hypothetical protein N0V84_012254 [Fusarium piperis]|uniref:DUF7924 domain-containing protein n=1 Tax=Fusarium piperis TaxID=1435070 RepID=A0A9W8TAK1_9HYPO|nr:hypothetical protein N0V84_012254 [Fusarium piperis]
MNNGVFKAQPRSTKRQLDQSPANPAKKARLSNADKLEQNASFLDEFADPFQPSPQANTEHSFVLEWLESLGSDRDTRCRSDSHLQATDDNAIPRRLARSAPAMSYTRDSDGFTVPPMPASTGSRSRTSDATGSSSGPSGRSLVENPLYRDMNLASNSIHLRSSRDRFPDQVADLIDSMRRDRDSPGPTLDEVWEDKALEELGIGAAESDVEKYFQNRIFPDGDRANSLKRSDRLPMAKHTVPSTGSGLKVSTPVPDMLYGYNRQNAFPQHLAQLISIGPETVANTQGLIYPFFIVEFKADGPSGAGSLWVATNQCLGGSASCVNIAEKLNHRLRQCQSDMVHPTDSASFSIAMSGTEARLYISWKHNELDYYMANVKSFLLQDAEHFIEFRKYVRNIIDWGRGERLEGIRKSLDSLLEESQKRSSAAKSRMPPSADSAGSSSCKMRKTSSTAPKGGHGAG